MARPSDLNAFVFDEKLPEQAKANWPGLPELPEVPAGGGGSPPVIDFPEPALDSLSDLPDQAQIPDWLI